jgi:histone H3/H4
MAGLSLRSIRRVVAERLPKRKVSEDAMLALKSSLEQTAYFVLDRAAQAHDHENVVRKQIGERPRVRLNAKHIRTALGVDSEQGQDGHA